MLDLDLETRECHGSDTSLSTVLLRTFDRKAMFGKKSRPRGLDEARNTLKLVLTCVLKIPKMKVWFSG